MAHKGKDGRREMAGDGVRRTVCDWVFATDNEETAQFSKHINSHGMKNISFQAFIYHGPWPDKSIRWARFGPRAVVWGALV